MYVVVLHTCIEYITQNRCVILIHIFLNELSFWFLKPIFQIRLKYIHRFTFLCAPGLPSRIFFRLFIFYTIVRFTTVYTKSELAEGIFHAISSGQICTEEVACKIASTFDFVQTVVIRTIISIISHSHHFQNWCKRNNAARDQSSDYCIAYDTYYVCETRVVP